MKKKELYETGKELVVISCRAIQNNDDECIRKIQFHKANAYIELMYFMGLIDMEESTCMRKNVMDSYIKTF